MTIRGLVLALDSHAPAVLAVLAVLPAAGYAAGRLHEPGGGAQPPWKWVYATLVYATCVPGMLSASLGLYALLFTGENLLDASMTVYFAAPAAMIVTLAILRNNVDFDQVPGFDKIGGLLGLLGTTFLAAFVLQRLQLVVFARAPGWTFLALAAGLFALLRWSSRRVLGPGHPARP